MTNKQYKIKSALSTVTVWEKLLTLDMHNGVNTSISFNALKEAKIRANKLLGFEAL